ncbi:MAG TPA: pyridoxal-dependent decarboxylase, partial [Longimicrobiales bacterium]
ESGVARNLMDYGVSLGRRFRALKLWFVIRQFGTEGIAANIRRHISYAAKLEQWIRDSKDFEVLAPRHFSVVVFRYHPPGVDDEAKLEAINTRILDAVNASGEIFLSHTKTKGRYAIRVAIGNLRTTESHVLKAWELLKNANNLVEV